MSYVYPMQGMPVPANQDDHFIMRNGKYYAGTHLIIDLWGAKNIDNIEFIEETLKRAVDAVGATLLHVHLHHFNVNSGVSGVVVLAESHISIHTWPEKGYAALDVFTCGDCNPENAIPVLEEAFLPEKTVVETILRGDMTNYEQQAQNV